MPGNSATVSIAIEVDDKGSVKIRQLGEAARKAGDEGARGFEQMGKSAGAIERGVNTAAASMRSLIGVAAGVAGAVAAIGLGNQFLQTAKEFERFNAQLTTLKGSSAEAKQALDWMADFAAKTPYALNQVVEAFVKLESYGLSGTRWMQTLGDTAAAMGKPLSQAVEAVADAVTGEFERLKEFGVRAKQEGDTVAFSWTQNGEQMTISSAKNSEAIQSALDKIFSRFDGQMVLMSSTWEGMMSNLGDWWTGFQRQVMDSGLFDSLKKQLAGVLVTLDQLKKDGTMDKMAKDVADLAQLILDALPSAFTAVITGIDLVGKAFLGWQVIWNGLAYVFTGLVGGIIAGFNAMITHMRLGFADFISTISSSWAKVQSAVLSVDGGAIAGGSGLDIAALRAEELDSKLAELQSTAAKAKAEIMASGAAGQKTADEWLASADKYGAAFTKGVDATIAWDNSMKGIKSAVDAYSASLDASKAKVAGMADGMGKAGDAADTAGRQTEELATQTDKAAKAEREAIAQVAVAMRNYADAAEPGTRATEEWAKGATDAAEAMADLNEHYETAGLSEYDALMVELNREFAEGQAAIQAYDTAVAEANTKVATASKEYEAAEAKLAEYRKQLDGTSLSAEQLQDKLGTAVGVVEKKREALDAAEAAARKLETANGGVAATEEDLRKRIFETNESLEQQRQAYIDAATKGDDFFAGVAAGALEMQDSMMTLGRVGYEVFNELREGWRDSFFAVMSGDLDDLGDIWDSTLQAMLRAFTDFIADLVMAWAAAGIADMFGFRIPGFGGGMGSIGSAIGASLGSGSGAAGSWLGAAGYQPGAGAGWTSYAGPALATAGGAYALYDAANKASKGEMNAGTAIEAAGGAYLAYTGGSALWSKLGGAAAAPIIQDMVVPASSEIMIAASDLTLLGPQTGGIGNAIAGGGAGAAVGPMAATAGALALWGGLAYGINKLGSTPTQQAVEWDQLNNYGTWGRDRGSFRSDQRPGWEMSGSGDAAMQSWGTIDSTASKYGFEVLEGEILSFVEAAKQSLADLTSTMGQEWADLAAGLENSVPAYDAYLDAIMGVDVAMEQSAEIHRLAQQAAADNGASLVHLTNALKAMGMSDEMARASAVALVAAVDQQQAASVSAASAAQSMAAAVADFSSTPLNIRVKVNVDTNMGGDSYMAPRHADGGIFIGPTLIPSINGRNHLVGEAGAEAITPLHAGPDTLKKMDAKLDALLSGGRPVQHVINLDGRQIASATLPYVDAHVAGKASRGALTRRTVF